ncbi:hypothetical protein M6B38_103095 [Iris pallida]|uniref:Secreted protein n=1 Tax=Iris pallida TaxID=29817 RepID=A0AAX6G6H8_IRIPA|nr:hypothetical protein M6B38_103095 [Iris pallida]
MTTNRLTLLTVTGIFTLRRRSVITRWTMCCSFPTSSSARRSSITTEESLHGSDRISSTTSSRRARDSFSALDSGTTISLVLESFVKSLVYLQDIILPYGPEPGILAEQNEDMT